MSFILDALKKSENERQRQAGPSLADARISRHRNDKPWWVLAVAALLVVNLGVLIVVLTRGDARSAPRAAPAATAGTAAPAPLATPGSFQGEMQEYGGNRIPTGDSPLPAGQQPLPPNPAVRRLADEAATYDYGTGIAGAAVVPQRPPIVRPIEAPAVAPAAMRPPIDTRTFGQPEVLPTINDVMASGTTLPELHLDIHVNSGNPAERFVFINMRKYTEGQTLNEGPVVERINADGVILNHHGLRFLLPRQQ